MSHISRHLKAEPPDALLPTAIMTSLKPGMLLTLDTHWSLLRIDVIDVREKQTMQI